MQSMKADQERVSKLLTDTVTLLCKNGLIYKDEIKIQGLLGITLDKNDVFIVHINETITSKDGSSDGAGKKGPMPGVPVVDLTRIADTPMIPAQQLRGMGGLVPGMPQSLGGAGGAGMGSRKQRPLMPQMMPRGQYMPVPRFRMGMPPHSPASLQAAMASQMNNHMMYSRQPGAHPGMPQVRHRMPQAPPHLVTPRRQQMQQPLATVSIDDDEDVVIIGTGHEEPCPNWNSPVRRNQQGRSSSQQLGNSSHAKSTTSISLSNTVTPTTPAVSAVASSLAEVDQIPITVTLGENILEETNDLEISLNETDKDGDSQPKLIQILNEVDQSAADETVPVTTAAMLIEPNDNVSDGDVDHAQANPEADPVSEQLPSETVPKDDGVLNRELSELKVDAKIDPELTLDSNLKSGETEGSSSAEGNSKISRRASYSKLITFQQGDKPADKSSDGVLPVVYTDIAVDPEPPLFDGSQVTDMDIQTLGFDILTEDDHDVVHSSSHLTPWICKLPVCNASFAEAKDLATHYVQQHTDLLNLMSSSCSLPLTTDSSTSEGSERGSLDGSGRKKLVKMMHCPFTGCQNKFSSWPGLNLHHKRVHGAPMSLKERKEIVALYGKPFKCTASASCQKSYMTKRELYRHVTKAHEAQEGSDSSSPSIPASTSNAVASVSSEPGTSVDAEAATTVTKNFLCLYSDCEVISSSREALVEHLQACHASASGPDNSSSSGVKEETAEDDQWPQK